MKKEFLLSIFKERKLILFLSVFISFFPILVFASAGDNISGYHLVGFVIVGTILAVMLFLFVLINKKHIRKIKNNKKLFLFGIIPCLITTVLVLVASIISFLRVFRISFDTLSYLIMNFVNWTLGALFLYSILVVLVGIYFIFKKNKDMSYGFLKLGISIFGACLVIYGIIVMISSGPADYM